MPDLFVQGKEKFYPDDEDNEDDIYHYPNK